MNNNIKKMFKWETIKKTTIQTIAIIYHSITIKMVLTKMTKEVSSKVMKEKIAIK